MLARRLGTPRLPQTGERDHAALHPTPPPPDGGFPPDIKGYS